MTQPNPDSSVRHDLLAGLITGIPVRIVKLFDESLFWYQNSMGATVEYCDLDDEWAVLRLGSAVLVLLSGYRANENAPIGTAVCIAVVALVKVEAWAKSRDLPVGVIGAGPWGRDALWLADPGGNIILCYVDSRTSSDGSELPESNWAAM